MKIETVIDQLKDLIKDRHSFLCEDGEPEWNEIYIKDINALNQAIDELSKAIKKKPVDSYCPSCNRHLRCPKSEHLISGRTKNRTGDNYCPSCGQALDWSVKDEL